MGTWGPDIFDNDDASDWLGDFLDRPGKRFLEQTLRKVVVASSEYLEAPHCSAAVAAAEVVARLAARPRRSVREDIREYLKVSKIKVDQALIDLSLNAIERVVRDSELRDLWEDSRAEAWYKTMKALKRRLTRAQHRWK
jgi:hypothetical protein